jgi:DNA repair exonuclease SbcCD ATPase subunit
MRVISVEFHNVFRFGETDNILNLDDVFATSDDDIALITGSIDGDENDSNGAGKSTIGEALYWAFFEKIPRLTRNSDRKGSATGEIIRTDDNGDIADGIKEAYVKVIFKTRNGHLWSMKCGRKISKSGKHTPIFELECEGEKKGGDKEELIGDIIRSNAATWLNSIFFAQMDTGKFLSGTDKARRDIIMDLRGMTIIDLMIRVLREKHKKNATKTYDELTVRSEAIRERLEGESDSELRKKKAEEAAKLYGVDAKVEEINSLIGALEQREEKKAAESIGQRMATYEAELQSAISERKNSVKGIVDSIDEISKAISSNKQRLDTEIKSDKDNLERRFLDANKQISSHSKESLEARGEKIADAKKRMVSARENAEKTKADLEGAISANAKIDSDMDSLKREMKSLSELKDSGECPTCGNKWSVEEMEQKIASVQGSIDAGEEERKKKSEDLESARAADVAARSLMDEIQEIIDDEPTLTADVEKIRYAKKEIESCKERAEEVKRDEKRLLSDIESLENKLSEANEQLSEKSSSFDTKIDNIRSLIEGCNKEMEEVSEAVKKIDDEITSKREEIVGLLNSKAGVAAEIGKIDEKLNSRKKDADILADLKIKIKEEKRIIERIDYLDKRLSGDIKNDVAESCMPLLNFYANEFLSILRDGMRVEFGFDGKNITIRLIGSTASSYNMLSGGEQSALRLAVSMALSMISIGGAADLPDMIFLDEIFGPLDSKTRDNVMRLLKRLKKNFDRIIVITHDSMIKDRFKTRIHIDKSDGISHISY